MPPWGEGGGGMTTTLDEATRQLETAEENFITVEERYDAEGVPPVVEG